MCIIYRGSDVYMRYINLPIYITRGLEAVGDIFVQIVNVLDRMLLNCYYCGILTADIIISPLA